MGKNTYRKWLYQELMKWVDEGLVTPENGKIIAARYQLSAQGSSLVTYMFCNIIGAIMVGLGVLLYIAYSWEAMAQTSRLWTSVAVLGFSQLLNLGIIWTKRQGSGLAEGAGIFHGIVVFSVIMALAQTFYLGASTAGYILMGLLMILPMMYLLRSSSLTVLYVVMTIVYGLQFDVDQIWGGVYLVWPLLACMVPMYLRLWRSRNSSIRLVWLSWFLALAIYSAFILSMEQVSGIIPILFYACITAITFLSGALIKQLGRWGTPFRIVGQVGLIGVLLIASMESTWIDIRNMNDLSLIGMAVLFVLFVLALGLYVLALKKRSRGVVFLGFVPLLIGAGAVLAYQDIGIVAITVVMNIYVAGIGLSVLFVNRKNRHIQEINWGLLILFALIACRFFDTSFSYSARALVFIVMGALLLAVNVWLAWKSMNRQKLQQQRSKRSIPAPMEEKKKKEVEEPAVMPARQERETVPEPVVKEENPLVEVEDTPVFTVEKKGRTSIWDKDGEKKGKAKISQSPWSTKGGNEDE